MVEIVCVVLIVVVFVVCVFLHLDTKRIRHETRVAEAASEAGKWQAFADRWWENHPRAPEPTQGKEREG